ncbi:HAMP domain-containing protein [bacterium]|nr:HAMP domain-containing protein [bacterium]
MSIFKKIIGSFLLVSVIPIAIFGVFIVNKVFDITKRKTFENNLSLSRQICFQVDTYFDTIQKLLESLASLPEIKDFDKEKVDRLLDSYHRSYTIYYGERVVFEADPFESFTILDNKGTVKTISPFEESYIGLNYFNQSFFQEVINTKKIYFSPDVSISLFTAEPIIKAAVPVFGENKEISFVIEADIKLESILQLINQARVGETGYFFAINKKGVFVAHPNEKLVLHHQNIEDLAPGLLSKFLKKGFIGGTALYPQERPSIVLAYSFPETVDWIIVLRQSLDEALEEAVSIRNQFIFTLFIITFLVGFVAFCLSRGITTPLKKLTKKVEEIGVKGDFGAEINIKTGDELEELALSFNQMMRRLKTKTTELKKKTIELQKKTIELEKKTREIQKKKEELEKFYKLTVGRELRMIELKKKIKELEKKVNKDSLS